MKELIDIVTVDKQTHDVTIQQYENFEELMLNATGSEILEAYNFRYRQLQCQDAKKKLKPRRIPLKEKRSLAFNLFTPEELAETCKDAGIFEDYMEKKLEIIENKISKGEIV